ncbi:MULTISPECIES: SulP family inorganic anion transporter [unclassified Zymobacter]|uniref:SulP family inorganic anion transporter n=1 Tax=unclassified Zymobacter TaxID=3048685 RepID=UPI0039C4C70C
MLMLSKKEWFGNPKNDILAGIVVSLALIPEAIAFSIIAGVDPKVGLYASFCIAVVCAFTGGRPAMISAATGATALLMVTLVRDHGVDYLFPMTMLVGIIQLIFGLLRLGTLMRFVARPILHGFVNALGILLFLSQVHELIRERGTLLARAAESGHMAPAIWISPLFVIVGLIIIYGLPRIPKVGRIIPSPLVCIIVLTAVCAYLQPGILTVADKGKLPDSLPHFLWFNVPLNFETLMIILKPAILVSIVGLLESMMTATVVDEYTHTPSDKNRECRGLGLANIVSSLFGGMAGCAMIGQTSVNLASGGRTRLSTLIGGVGVLILSVFLKGVVGQIPLAALAAVMTMVAIGTFRWRSFKELFTLPKTTNITMVATVVVVVSTNNLVYGVVTGILLNVFFFTYRFSRLLSVDVQDVEEGVRKFNVKGQLFFGSALKFNAAFDSLTDVRLAIIDMSQVRLWDHCAVVTLDRIRAELQRTGTTVELRGLSPENEVMISKYSELRQQEEGPDGEEGEKLTTA